MKIFKGKIVNRKNLPDIKLKQYARNNGDKIVSFADLHDLPVPVLRFFRFALKEGREPIGTAKVREKGEFDLNDKWIPFESEQHFSAGSAAFIWDANMDINPLMNVPVRDAYLANRGSMKVKTLLLWTVVDVENKK